MNGQLHALAALSLGKSPQYPLERRLGGPQNRLDDVEKRKFLTVLGLELRLIGRPAHRQSLYQLHYPGSTYLQA
jgi:hypothetical protein